ncbi:MAG: 3-phosphoshikimate 1-carboxyvinyltransferase [Fusobacterium perfoetens]|uniref:3-phosphoshikimate 1-carboxyvinyltransferase n=1 Tax=Fusobacterium perfoetens TaxID=852 RepID=UPI0023F573D5|nr:3-phosphoshikimate 1-carboxyvinyltransferase [Fusobacterium perfoetens]MCI6152425.1 3-phosphoshikimate 1-carboxyvinyltransferase [Fusobacterium perfoetens]MDY3237024.1 3-phosphoshikimate 1-carboxyvinyltransferase [Fusobacterium perfoetens]
MKDIIITPNSLNGEVIIPSSKSIGHREIICASLGDGESIVDNISMSKDIEATCNGLRNFGASIKEIPSKIKDRRAFLIEGVNGKIKLQNKNIYCNESGSTLRFLIPLGALSSEEIIFNGEGKLKERPLDPYFEIFKQDNINFETCNDKINLPLKINGKLKGGKYFLPGNVSSQFVSGLLFALPLIENDSVIEITSSLESASYVDLTLDSLKKYGISIENQNHKRYIIKGNQKYKNIDSDVEGDFSQGAFWLVAGALTDREVISKGLNIDSLQGDKKILEILEKMGVNLKIEKNKIISSSSNTKGTIIDANDCPDIIPILTVLAALSEGETKIINAGRLRIKECDRLNAIATELNKIGGEVVELSDGLIIRGKKSLNGGKVECWNDHRIAMSLGIASIKCKEKLILSGANCVDKSYPNFWNDFINLEGKIEEIK